MNQQVSPVSVPVNTPGGQPSDLYCDPGDEAVGVYAAADVRAMDALAIEGLGIAGFALMERAAAAAFALLQDAWPGCRQLGVFCGAGNNAGDGYLVAELAARAGIAVEVCSLVSAERLRGDAAAARERCEAAGVPISPFSPAVAARLLARTSLIVDALLGTGLDRALAGDYLAAVAQINAAPCEVLALDVPSGLHADSGAVLGAAVAAACTVSFVALNTGLFLGHGPDHCGRVVLAPLGLPETVNAPFTPCLSTLGMTSLRAALPPRQRMAHKGDHGHLLIIGGAPGMAGAARLAAEAALRSGAGLVSVVTHPDSVPLVMAGRPEIMCHGVADGEALRARLDTADGVVIGPGLGRTAWSESLWKALEAWSGPLIIDADGLHWLALAGGCAAPCPVLTPHPGEAARLLDLPTAAVTADRLAAVRRLAARYAAVVVLKGARTLIAEPAAEAVAVCLAGNPGMASAGMGDVLAGCIGGLAGQGLGGATAARVGVHAHALAGDAAAAGGERGLLAGDVIAALRQVVNPCRS